MSLRLERIGNPILHCRQLKVTWGYISPHNLRSDQYRTLRKSENRFTLTSHLSRFFTPQTYCLAFPDLEDIPVPEVVSPPK